MVLCCYTYFPPDVRTKGCIRGMRVVGLVPWLLGSMMYTNVVSAWDSTTVLKSAATLGRMLLVLTRVRGDRAYLTGRYSLWFWGCSTSAGPAPMRRM